MLQQASLMERDGLGSSNQQQELSTVDGQCLSSPFHITLFLMQQCTPNPGNMLEHAGL